MEWIDSNTQMPDADETVLLYMPDSEGEPVWPGYFECYGDMMWLLADGMPAGRVTHWMSFPEGPEKLVQSTELKAALRALAEAQKASDFNFEQYQDAGSALFKTAEQCDELLASLRVARDRISIDRESLFDCHKDYSTETVTDELGMRCLAEYDDTMRIIDAAIARVNGDDQ